ncbi:histidine kinase dimerization/phospho-acceptor domain-containing protein [Lysobacter sp. F6437]|uniref:histidine kinase dimerization/phospho-acceptor domain-containing protein n=1 Tax=Lysobacter sp. F6437 TaxID=3459296 RepID=UPI00403D7A3C
MADARAHRGSVSTEAAGDADPTAILLDRLAHDLRGPLSPLQTAAYLLRRPDLEPDRRDELLAIIDRQTTRLSSMVQEVSDWARARQSRLVSRREAIVPSMLVELAVTSSKADVRLDVAAELDERTLDGDAQRLVQMLVALVGFMHSRHGEVVMTAELAEQGVRIDIAADGSPWSPGERESLFTGAEAEPFDEGLGLRLMIAKAIAQAHGGDMRARETRNGLAMVRVLLPLRAAAAED